MNKLRSLFDTIKFLGGALAVALILSFLFSLDGQPVNASNVAKLFFQLLNFIGFIYFYSRFSDLKKEVAQSRQTTLYKLHPEWDTYQAEQEVERDSKIQNETDISIFILLVISLFISFEIR